MNEFKIKNGLIVQGPMTATFAYTTASWAESASHLPNKQYTITASRADTASYLVPANNYSASKIHLGGGVVIEDYDLAGGQLGVPGLHVGTANLNINDKATIWSSGQADFIGVTSSLHGTASWADNASHARTASYLPVNTYKITSSWAETASQARTASYIKASDIDGLVEATIETASYAHTASNLTSEAWIDGRGISEGALLHIARGTEWPEAMLIGSDKGLVIAPEEGTDGLSVILAANLMPSGSRDIGDVSDPWNEIYANKFIGTASQAETASYLPVGEYAITSSWAHTASYALFCASAAYASFATESITASYLKPGKYEVTVSLADTASYLDATASQAKTASYLPNARYIITASLADTASYLPKATYEVTSSWAVEARTASYLNPSNNYTASKMRLTSELNVNGNATILSTGQATFTGVTSSLRGTASWADNASHARTASYLPVNTYKITSSWAETASLLDGLNIQNAGITLNTTKTPTVVMEMDTGSYLAAFFDYACASASNIRAGTIFGSWVGGNVTYAEVSNIDIGNTEQITMSVTINGAKVQLKSEAYSTTPWTIKALGRYI